LNATIFEHFEPTWKDIPTILKLLDKATMVSSKLAPNFVLNLIREYF